MGGGLSQRHGENIALIPNTLIPVSVDTVNDGNPMMQMIPPSNPDLYNDNDPSNDTPPYEIEYDGFTNVFEAIKRNLAPGKHHIKIAIADAMDIGRDSAVMIQSSSFSSTRSLR